MKAADVSWLVIHVIILLHEARYATSHSLKNKRVKESGQSAYESHPGTSRRTLSAKAGGDTRHHRLHLPPDKWRDRKEAHASGKALPEGRQSGSTAYHRNPKSRRPSARQSPARQNVLVVENIEEETTTTTERHFELATTGIEYEVEVPQEEDVADTGVAESPGGQGSDDVVLQGNSGQEGPIPEDQGGVVSSDSDRQVDRLQEGERAPRLQQGEGEQNSVQEDPRDSVGVEVLPLSSAGSENALNQVLSEEDVIDEETVPRASGNPSDRERRLRKKNEEDMRDQLAARGHRKVDRNKGTHAAVAISSEEAESNRLLKALKTTPSNKALPISHKDLISKLSETKPIPKFHQKQQFSKDNLLDENMLEDLIEMLSAVNNTAKAKQYVVKSKCDRGNNASVKIFEMHDDPKKTTGKHGNGRINSLTIVEIKEVVTKSGLHVSSTTSVNEYESLEKTEVPNEIESYVDKSERSRKKTMSFRKRQDNVDQKRNIVENKIFTPSRRETYESNATSVVSVTPETSATAVKERGIAVKRSSKDLQLDSLKKIHSVQNVNVVRKEEILRKIKSLFDELDDQESKTIISEQSPKVFGETGVNIDSSKNETVLSTDNALNANNVLENQDQNNRETLEKSRIIQQEHMNRETSTQSTNFQDESEIKYSPKTFHPEAKEYPDIPWEILNNKKGDITAKTEMKGNYPKNINVESKKVELTTAIGYFADNSSEQVKTDTPNGSVLLEGRATDTATGQNSMKLKEDLKVEVVAVITGTPASDLNAPKQLDSTQEQKQQHFQQQTIFDSARENGASHVLVAEKHGDNPQLHRLIEEVEKLNRRPSVVQVVGKPEALAKIELNDTDNEKINMDVKLAPISVGKTSARAADGLEHDATEPRDSSASYIVDLYNVLLKPLTTGFLLGAVTVLILLILGVILFLVKEKLCDAGGKRKKDFRAASGRDATSHSPARKHVWKLPDVQAVPSRVDREDPEKQNTTFLTVGTEQNKTEEYEESSEHLAQLSNTQLSDIIVEAASPGTSHAPAPAQESNTRLKERLVTNRHCSPINDMLTNKDWGRTYFHDHSRPRSRSADRPQGRAVETHFVDTSLTLPKGVATRVSSGELSLSKRTAKETRLAEKTAKHGKLHFPKMGGRLQKSFFNR